MKGRLFVVMVILALAIAGIHPQVALAGAYGTTFTTSITYQNVGGSATTNLEILFYSSPDDTTPTSIPRTNLAPNASTSLFIGSLSEIGTGFQGSAVMVSDQPMLATMVQLPQNSTTVLNRPLSNGFSAGTNTVLIATVLKNTFDQTTRFAVQNAGAAATDVTVTFYNTNAQQVHQLTQNIAPQAAYHIDAGQISQLGSAFNGSAVIQAAAGGEIVASVMELNINGNGASAFEGVGQGAQSYYMPSALCKAFGGQDSAYAVQNTDLGTDTNVTVRYYNAAGTEVASETQNVGPGSKKSFIACNATGMATGFSGSAVVSSDATDIIAIGKVFGLGLSTAFIGAAQGNAKLALPYVRWATDANFNAMNNRGQRTFIAIQNIGGSEIPANQIKIDYIDPSGNIVGTHTYNQALGPRTKFNSNASLAGLSEFGYAGGTFGGGAIVTGPAGSQLAVVARVASKTTTGQVSEDYNGMPVP
jgi:hypothetical protein